MKTVYPKSPIWNYNDWIRYIHSQVNHSLYKTISARPYTEQKKTEYKSSYRPYIGHI